MIDRIYAIDGESLVAIQDAIIGRSGGGTGGGMETRIACLEAKVGHIESDVKEIKSDLRLLLAAIVGSFLIVAGMLVVGYLKISDQISQPPKITVVTTPAPTVPASPGAKS